MKIFLTGLALVLSSAFSLAEPPRPAPAPPAPAVPATGASPESDRRFGFNPEYKKPQVLTDAFFNPFKIQTEVTLAKKEGAGVTNDSVAAAIGQRGVSGIVYGSAHGANRVIIGDQVFSLGDELTFPSGDKGGAVPLVAGAAVVLREIGKDRLGVDVSGEGDTPRRVTFALRNFWQP